MSALGQKQTLPDISAMSALPPIADIGTGTVYHLSAANDANGATRISN